MARPTRKTTKATKKTTKPAKPRLPEVKVDRRLKLLWQEALERFRKALSSETESWDERYEALGEILDSTPPYHLAGGYKTARDFLRAELPGEDERSVRRHIRVARHFEPADEQRHGIEKLAALLDYLEAAGGAPLAPAKVDLARQKVRVAAGKTERLVPFADVQREDLRAATRLAQGRAGRVGKTVPPLVKALKQALGKAKLGAVGVRLRGGRVDLSGIAPERLGALGKALAAARLPED